MSFAIPARRLRETKSLLAFHHPRAIYPVHILLVPKKARPNLQALTVEDSDFYIDLFQVVTSLVEEFHLAEQGYRLIVNGGKYQEFPQLHFHLVSGESNLTV